MNKKPNRILFKDTESAVSYGEKANIEDMQSLLKKLYKILLQKHIDSATELQLFNESMHAYLQDNWYQSYSKREST